ncbi:unnamed protein product [Angiostrongylus costaricensis]|uniref:Metalloendopeptidase n=1 Tax=Angiostrongylus costaricensis TaxID=334426 RepID=A0A0R3Q209_ANGCS|nr:unnamed protein product [Angiostrongylus costaricensis]
MRTYQLLTAVAVVTHYEIIDSVTKTRDFFYGRERDQIENGSRVSTSGHNFFVLKETLTKELGSPEEQPDAVTQDKNVVVREGGCRSVVGRLRGNQFLSLDKGCQERNAVHDICHALGLLNTINRFDRDSYIQIVARNMKSSFLRDFTKVHPTYAEVYLLTYDYGSVLRYNEQAYIYGS